MFSFQTPKKRGRKRLEVETKEETREIEKQQEERTEDRMTKEEFERKRLERYQKKK